MTGLFRMGVTQGLHECVVIHRLALFARHGRGGCEFHQPLSKCVVEGSPLGACDGSRGVDLFCVGREGDALHS